jgi:hypothetical protein
MNFCLSLSCYHLGFLASAIGKTVSSSTVALSGCFNISNQGIVCSAALTDRDRPVLFSLEEKPVGPVFMPAAKDSYSYVFCWT